jgi:hypothetical protein
MVAALKKKKQKKTRYINILTINKKEFQDVL